MTGTEIVATGLILSSALIHSLWNAALKRADDRDAILGAINIIGAAIGLPFLFLVPIPTKIDFVWIGGSILVHLIYQVSLSRMLAASDYSLGYPLARGLGPVTVVIVSIFLIGATPSLWQLFAIAVIALGAIASGLGAAKGALSIPSFNSLKWALMVGLLIGGYTLIDGLSVKRMDISTFFVWSNVIIAPFMVLFLRTINGPGLTKRITGALRPGLLVFILSYGGYALALFAFQMGSIYEIAALRETSILFAVIVGAIWLKERLTPLRIFGALLITAGAISLKLL